MGVLLDVYIFLAWTGAWSTHSGFGAFFSLVLFAVILVFSVISSYVGGTLAIIMTVLSFGTSLLLSPVVAVISFIAYMLGVGDLLAHWCPTMFPVGGYMFSPSSASLWEWIILIVWAVLRGSSASFMKRHW